MFADGRGIMEKRCLELVATMDCSSGKVRESERTFGHESF